MFPSAFTEVLSYCVRANWCILQKVRQGNMARARRFLPGLFLSLLFLC